MPRAVLSPWEVGLGSVSLVLQVLAQFWRRKALVAACVVSGVAVSFALKRWVFLTVERTSLLLWYLNVRICWEEQLFFSRVLGAGSGRFLYAFLLSLVCGRFLWSSRRANSPFIGLCLLGLSMEKAAANWSGSSFLLATQLGTLLWAAAVFSYGRKDAVTPPKKKKKKIDDDDVITPASEPAQKKEAPLVEKKNDSEGVLEEDSNFSRRKESLASSTSSSSADEEVTRSKKKAHLVSTLRTIQNMFQADLSLCGDDGDDDDCGESPRTLLTVADLADIATIAKAAMKRLDRRKKNIISDESRVLVKEKIQLQSSSQTVDDDSSKIDRKKMRLAEKDESSLVLLWARQSFIVHKHKKHKALDVCAKLLIFRKRYDWPLRLEAEPLEAALRSGMHWVLPGRDKQGRRVIIFRAAALCPCPPRPLAELQQMMCLLLERLANDNLTLSRGLVFIVDLQGASPATARHFGVNDIHRGLKLVQNCFPLKLRNIFVLRLPRLLAPAAYAVKRFLPPKVKRRLHTSNGGPNSIKALLDDVPLDLIPTALGGTLTHFNWDHIVDRLLRAKPYDPADKWLQPSPPSSSS